MGLAVRSWLRPLLLALSWTSASSSSSATASPLASVLRRSITAFKVPVTTMRWQAELLRDGRRPMRVGVDLEIRENEKGRGLYALRELEGGELVGRYSGPVVPGDDFLESDSTGFYAMTLANGDVVDGEDEARSSFVRFINHSVRRQNCEARDAWEEGPIAAVYLETSRTIQPGEELLFDYGHEYWDFQMPRLSPRRIVIDYL